MERRCKIDSVPANVGQNEATTKRDKFVFTLHDLYIKNFVPKRNICNKIIADMAKIAKSCEFP